MTRALRNDTIPCAENRHCRRKVLKLTKFLPIMMMALLLAPAAQAQQQAVAPDPREEAAKAECKAKSDPSILINYWKTAGAAANNPAALADLGNRAKAICVTIGGGSSHSYAISGNAGPMKVSGTACNSPSHSPSRGAAVV